MKRLLNTTLILLMLVLTACSASFSPTADSSTSAGSLPLATQLVIGTMKLDGTEQDVSAKQAAELLPMWQVYAELLISDTAAQEEINGLINQIQETMTDEQTKAITAMNLSQRDVMAVMQEQGVGMGGGQGLSADQIATAQALRNSTGGGEGFSGPPDGFAGGPPDGGVGMPGGGFSSAGQSSSGANATTAMTGAAAGRGEVPSALIEALIELLKAKANS